MLMNMVMGSFISARESRDIELEMNTKATRNYGLREYVSGEKTGLLEDKVSGYIDQ